MTEEKSIFRCPVCHGELHTSGKSLCCINGHTYDVAREGYVNLLLANQKASKEPGDSPDMLRARRRFLTAGYYSRLAETVADRITEHLNATGRNAIILDAGCGEGYYTEFICRVPAINASSTICGIDISREGIKLAARRRSGIQWGVAGVHLIPLPDSSVDIILNIFAPHDADEFSRIIRDDGIFISVIPGPEHLLGLKEELYETVTLHDAGPPEIKGFRIESIGDLKYEFTVSWPQMKSDLLQMTPYYWKTKPGRIKALEKSPTPLTTIAHFTITVYRK